jgi:uncharacterized protein YuzE
MPAGMRSEENAPDGENAPPGLDDHRQDGDDQLETAGHAMKIVYSEEDDILFIEFSKGAILRDESVGWNINLGYTADGVGEITILEAQKSGIYPLQIERVVSDAA